MATRHTTFRLDEPTLYRLANLSGRRGASRTQIVREAAFLYEFMERRSAHDALDLCDDLTKRYGADAYLDLHFGSDDPEAWRLGRVPVRAEMGDEPVPEIEAFGLPGRPARPAVATAPSRDKTREIAIYIRRRCDELADLYSPGLAYPLGQIVVGHVLPSEQEVGPDHPDWLRRVIAQFAERKSRYSAALDSLRPEEASEFAPLLASETWTPEGADE